MPPDSAPAAPAPAAPRLIRPFQRFFALEASSAVLLMACALGALAWANSPFAPAYDALWHTPVTVGVGAAVLTESLAHWVNDGLMALFFFVVGLEIKREVLVGELRSPRKAALALAGALGGMLVPALVYTAVNGGGPGAHGWGVPMATDIAFALGVLALAGRRAPAGLKVFLTALAIADDLGAVLVIALFYTSGIAWGALAAGLGLLAALAGLARMGVRHTWVFVVFGLAIWLAFLLSGVHATVAGVLVALTVPARRVLDEHAFTRAARRHLAAFAARVDPTPTDPDDAQRHALLALRTTLRSADAPLFRMEHALHPWVAYGILPLFALANAGVLLGGADAGGAVTLGVVLGLVAGKPVGVLLFTWAAVRLGLAALPARVGWREMAGVAALTGIGFTMSLFVAGLAFDDAALLDEAKIGIFAGSILAGATGALLLRWAARRPPSAEAA